MHDQRKVKEEIDEKTRALNETKIARFRQLYDECFALRSEKNYSRDALKRLDLLQELNPELYTMCNYRRNILLHLWKEPSMTAEEQSETKANDLEAELELSTRIITKDYKVYSAWVHRKWLIEQLDPERRKQVLLGENKKCEGLLKLDERNFHVWGYRRWVTGLLSDMHAHTWEHDWSFTKAKIGQNFSNYSAWHSRALILGDRLEREVTAQLKLANREGEVGEELCATLSEEMSLAERAFYADPNDQSSWFYARYLLRLLKLIRTSVGSGTAQSAYDAAVQLVESACTEIQLEAASDPDGEAGNAPLPPYWSVLMLRHVRDEHGSACSKVPESDERARELRVLISADPQRKGYYEELLQR